MLSFDEFYFNSYLLHESQSPLLRDLDIRMYRSKNYIALL